jgi:hypothetical protein
MDAWFDEDEEVFVHHRNLDSLDLGDGGVGHGSHLPIGESDSMAFGRHER